METSGFLVLILLAFTAAEDDFWVKVKNVDKYYLFMEEEMTYWDAKLYCTSENGSLTSLKDLAAVNTFTQMAEQYLKAESFWIGLTSYQTNVWRWENKDIKGIITNWDSKTDKDFKWERCALSIKDTGKWKTGNCGEKNAFTCEKGEGITPESPDIPVEIDGDCPKGFVEVGAGTNKCFKVVELSSDFGDDKVNWALASLTCSEPVTNGRYPDIASVGSILEQAVINAQLKYHYEGGLWIGMRTYSESKLEDEDFFWTDNSDTLFKYFGEYGIAKISQALCVSIYHHLYGKPGEWRNDLCDMPKGYVCQVFKDPENIIPRNQTEIDPNPRGYCKDGYTDSDGMFCYKLELDEPKTWKEAQTYCNNDAAWLISFFSNIELARIALEIHRKSTSVWIGLNAPNHDDDAHYFQWSNGQAIDFLNWADGEPITKHYNDTLDGCVEMSWYDGTWTNELCNRKMGFVCMEKATVKLPLPPKIDTEGLCPGEEYGLDLWKGNPNSDQCYIKFDHNSVMTTWRNAEQHCEEFGTNSKLLSFTTYEEFLYVKPLMSHDRTPFWIGLYATDDHYLSWTDGSYLVYSNFAIGEPNYANGHCTEMMTHEYPFRWRMADCYSTLNYMCKAPKQKNSTEKNNCPVDFVKMGGDCYSFHPDARLTFQEARENCQNSHADANLLSVMNFLENEAMRSQMIKLDKNPVHKPFWLGLDVKIQGGGKGHVKWLDGNKYRYANWHNVWAQPSYPGECGIVNPKDGKWSVAECAKGDSDTHAYVCKMKNPSTHGGHHAGKIAGIVIGSLIAIILVIALVYYLVVHGDIGNKISNLKPRTESRVDVADKMENPNYAA